MKPIYNIAFFVFFFVAVISCSSDENIPEVIKSNEKQIISFVLSASENSNLQVDIIGTVNQSNKTIALTVPNGTAINSLTAEIAISAKASINPTGPQDFTNPVKYTVTAEDGTKTIYNVTIEVLPPDSTDPTLDSIDPDNGPMGTLVTINGENFGEDAGKVKVYFNDTEATVSQLSNTSIIAAVPAKAYSGLVKVVIDGTELIGPSFSYTISEIQVTTFAGSPTPGSADGLGINAQFKNPSGLAFDSDGILYVADAGNSLIRKISPDGYVTTFAGTTPGYLDGTIDNARFSIPTDMVLDENGYVFVADADNHKIRKITPDGMVSTFAGSTQGYNDGQGDEAQFYLPHQIVIDSDQNLIVSDFGGDKIRKITPEGIVSTIAGSTGGFADGVGTAAMFEAPIGLLIDENDILYVVDHGNHKIRRVSESGEVTTYAGDIQGYLDGTLDKAQFREPSCIAMDQYGVLYVADGRNYKIRKITPEGVVSTLAGSTLGYKDGSGATAQFSYIVGIVVDANGTIFVADQVNNCIRKITQE